MDYTGVFKLLRMVVMSQSRGICTTISEWGSWGAHAMGRGIGQGYSIVRNSLKLKKGELGWLVLPIGAGMISATVFAAPSVVYTVLTESSLPLYLLRGVYAGAGVGLAGLCFKRAMKKDASLSASIDEKGAADQKDEKKNTGYVNLIKLKGAIDATKSFSADKVIPQLQKAFEDESAKGVIININSGGGSPVQSSLIHNEIIRLKNKYKKKVVIVGEDALASGAYYVAVSADKIYVNSNTATGSIGVVMEGYGVADVAKKLGVEHRVYTAGANKRRLDAFLPEKKEDLDKVKESLTDMHDDFMKAVSTGRNGKLKTEMRAEIFSGDWWVGVRAKEMGLVDELGGIQDVMEKEFQVSRFKDCTESSFLSGLFNRGFFGGNDAGLDLNVSLDLKSVTPQLRV
jgi:protease-4